MKKKLLSSILLTFCIGFSKDIDIKYVVQKALKNNLEIKAAQNELESKKYDYYSVKGMLLPKITLSDMYTRTNIAPWAIAAKMENRNLVFPGGPLPPNIPVNTNMLGSAFSTLQNFFNNPGTAGAFNQQIMLEIPIWIGGKIQAYSDASFYNMLSSQKNLDQTKQKVIKDAYDAYLGALLSKEGIALAQKAVDDAKRHVKMAQSYYKEGIALYTDALRAKVYLHEAQQKLVEAKNNYKVSKRALFLIMNEPYEKDANIKGELYCPSNINKDKLYSSIDEKPSIKAMRDKLFALDSYKRAVLGNHLPQIGAFGSYSIFSPNKIIGGSANGYTIGVNLSWNIFDGFSTFNKLKSLTEQKLMLQNYIDLMEKGSKFDIDKSYANYENALSEMSFAKKEKEEAKETLKVMENRYKVGLAKITDVLDSEVQLDKARFDYAKALYDCNKAYIDMLYSAGKLKEVVK